MERKSSLSTASGRRKSATDLTTSRPPARHSVDPNQEKKKARDPPTPSGGHVSAGGRVALRRHSENNKPKTLLRKELERLRSAAVVVSTDDRIEAQLEHEIKIRQIEEEAEREKQKFKAIDDAKLRGREGEKDIFSEDREKVLELSFIAKHEQEEEVKRVNQIMLNAKCHAIRDAQIQEKEELAKELKQDEIRLEQIMIERAKASLAVEDENVKKEVEKKKQYAAEIKRQLMERENQRFLEAERIEEEAKILAQTKEVIQRDEERRMRLDRDRREKLRAELNRISEMANLFQKMLFEQEREAEMRIQAYMKAKEERERKLAIEKKLVKQAFERKQQLLFDLQQKRLESKSKREDMALIRQQENIEREYRRKEMEAAVRKKELEKSLAEARMMQLHEAKLREALQLAHNEDDFKKIVENLKREEEKQKKLQEERLKNRERYREDIIRQMNDKEYARRTMMERDQAEAFEYREQEKQRQKNIVTVIQAKLAKMREANLPEKYIKDVEKQLMKIGQTSIK